MSEGGGSPPSTSVATPEEVPAQAEAVLAGAAASTSLATPALVVTSLLLLILCEAARRWLQRRQRSLRSHSLPERPPDHAYYEEIDRARELLLTANRRSAIASEREERERARFRSHDPRRWRISPSYARRRTPVLCAAARASSVPLMCPTAHALATRRRFGPGESSTFEHILCDWSVADRKLRQLERSEGMTIQRPPLAYSDDLARRGAQEAGCDWYFSVADFEHALLHGALELKQVRSRDDEEVPRRALTISLLADGAAVRGLHEEPSSPRSGPHQGG